ncbi:MAG: universal stress protein [Thermoplasmatota archaeon]
MPQSAAKQVLAHGTSRLPFKTILVGFDGSWLSHEAIRVALDLARWDGAQMVLATVVPKEPAEHGEGATGLGAGRQATQSKSSAEEALAEEARRMAQLGITTRTLVGTGDPTDELARLAQKQRADLIVVGAHALSTDGSSSFGSTARHIRGAANTSVLIVRPRPSIQRVVVAIDGSTSSLLAFGHAREIALRSGASLSCAYVAKEGATGIRSSVRESLREAGIGGPDGVPLETAFGEPADGILLAACAQRADLIAMGTRGFRPSSAKSIGSVSEAVSRRATCSVLVTRRWPIAARRGADF